MTASNIEVDIRLSPAEMSDLAAGVCLILFLAPLARMLVLAAWLAIVVLKFRLMKYGWRKGKIAFGIATAHAVTAVGSAIYSRYKDAVTRNYVSNQRYCLEAVDANATATEVRKCLILIPGTWDVSPTIPDYFTELIEIIKGLDAKVAIFIFKWPSTNDVATRQRAAQELTAALLAQPREARGAEVILVGYSHGGTVATLAGSILAGTLPAKIITASAPIIVAKSLTIPGTPRVHHARSTSDPVIAQLQVSHSARRRQYALTQVLRRQLLANVNSSKVVAVLRMLFLLFVLSLLPSALLVMLHMAVTADQHALPGGTTPRQLMWGDFVSIGTLFVLWFRNPVVETVYQVARQAIFAALFAANSPVFALLFGVSIQEVLAYRFRLREPNSLEQIDVPFLSPGEAHRGVLFSTGLVDVVRKTLLSRSV